MDAMDTADVLGLLRDGRPRTKSEIAEATGRVRSTVTLRLAELIESGLVVELPADSAGRGRPSARFALATASRVIGAVELDARHALVATTDLAGVILDSAQLPLDVRDGPVPVLDAVVRELGRQIDKCPGQRSSVAGVGLGLPGPVDPTTSRLIGPPLMPGWDRYRIAEHLSRSFPGPVLVANDVNVFALGEWVTAWPEEQDMLVVKVATGVGAGVIASGRPVTGSRGAGGHIGHVQVVAENGRPCPCGQSGCLGAYASGLGIAATLREQGMDVSESADVVNLLRAGDPRAVRVVREAGKQIGQVLSALVAALNPAVIVLGGEIAEAGEPLLAGIRESVYARSLPLATSNLHIGVSSDSGHHSITGAARLVQNALFGLPQRPVVYYKPTA